ncbi:hypothetical protein POF51_22255 [Brevibacillus sp. AG]|uniref:hypothetical protein n=1 Tax=Brevibacillus sp. AG TaxID=3020891 RepID=UPI00232F38D6|nr:hypothetical protein [Brevibacillus sp. AG]MDC0763451.1 hypothetical protein [Brevibacillus sp. AG]
MSYPVLCREKEMKPGVVGAEKTFNIADLSPEEQAEWARKHNLDLDKINGRIVQPTKSDDTSGKVQPTQPKELTRESYIQLKEQRYNDSQIRKMFDIKSPNDLTTWKEKNGLKGYKVRFDTSTSAVINEKTDIRFKKQSPGVEGQASQKGDPIVASLEEELAKKDDELQRYSSLLDEANRARVNAEAKAESMEIELRQHKKDKTPIDLRNAVACLMGTGEAAVDTFEEFQVLAEVLGKMKMPWIASHDTVRFNIETAP